MDPLTNPYTPNAGARPPALIGRDAQIDGFRLLLARLTRGHSERSMIVTGLRGVGKTVLLGRFRAIAEEQKWVVVEWEISKHDDTAFRRSIASRFRTALFSLSPRTKWKAKAQRAAGALRSFTLTMDPEGNLTAGFGDLHEPGTADSGDLFLDLPDLLVAIGEAAQEAGRGVVLLVDEVQFFSAPQLEAVIAAMHRTVQRELPVTMVGAGLPQIAQLAGEAKSYAERLFTFPVIGNLTPDQAVAALREPALNLGADWHDDALALASEATGQYPYFLQELGHSTWPLADGPVITRADVECALGSYQDRLDESFFRVRLDRTTDLERAYLRAMAELGPGPASTGDVAAQLARTSPQVAPTRATLIGKGLLYAPSHGLVAFTVPHFDSFMKRAVPDLVPPPVRQRRSGK